MMKDCREALNEEIIKSLLKNNQLLFNKYEKFKINRLVLSNQNTMKFCPEINCGSFAVRENINTNFVKCMNGHQFCFDCAKKWHTKRRCEEVLDEDFENWKKGKYIKQCPSCKFWTEKNEGCNHMTCRACSVEWCWFCGEKYVSNHYTRTGPCYGLQFSKIFYLFV
jgi:hypothetical protein